jgi:hypothetical protein
LSYDRRRGGLISIHHTSRTLIIQCLYILGDNYSYSTVISHFIIIIILIILLMVVRFQCDLWQWEYEILLKYCWNSSRWGGCIFIFVFFEHLYNMLMLYLFCLMWCIVYFPMNVVTLFILPQFFVLTNFHYLFQTSTTK